MNILSSLSLPEKRWHPIRQVVRGALSAALCGAALMASSAQAASSYPARPIHLVVPFSAGGGTDILARLFAKSASKTLGESVVVDNIDGAGGIIGALQVARAPADGYMLLFGTPGTVQINPAMKPVHYDPLKDFIAVSQFSDSAMVLVVNTKTPWHSTQDLINAARAKPGTINYGSAGVGSISHLSVAMFDYLAKVNMTHVPYRGTAPALTDLRAGRLQLEIENMPAVLGLIQTGQLRALAVGSAQPSPLLPGVPTLAQSGVPGYDSSSWTGVLAPAKTPPDVVAKLQHAVEVAAHDPDIIKTLKNLGAQPVGGTSDQFRTMLVQGQTLITETVKAAGLAQQ